MKRHSIVLTDEQSDWVKKHIASGSFNLSQSVQNWIDEMRRVPEYHAPKNASDITAADYVEAIGISANFIARLDQQLARFIVLRATTLKNLQDLEDCLKRKATFDALGTIPVPMGADVLKNVMNNAMARLL